MTKYIKGKDGKFQGSIGDGKNKVPTSPRFPPYYPDYRTDMSLPTMPQLNVSESARELSDRINADLDDLYTLSARSPQDHEVAIAAMRSRASAAQEAGHTNQHQMWTRISDLIDKARKEDWKPETTYLYVHWLQGETPRMVDADLRSTR